VIHGDGELQGGLNLAASASWHGLIRAQQAIVAGRITGGLSVQDKLEIGHTAVIRGKVSARTIAIAKGAIVDGEIEITSGAAVHEFEEKRDGKL
jgi:cytoskeletal protein CcmA (bactofilin family)